ncbi:hypothetical protein [Mycoplasmopsis cricetuli]|uniref:hypothetical protein n=1 Tax=Mycoplasmopsis cricetuli TaxID=171283 RepID=UPI0004723572|nr:hypothetical protein [Mycoplasmopsis cricetuli]
MYKLLRNLTILTTMISPLFFLSCSQKKQEFKLQKQIHEAVNNASYDQIKPLIYFPFQNSSRKDFTGEALDCMNFIKGNSFVDKNNNQYNSVITGVFQYPLQNSIEINTVWTIDGITNENVKYPKKFIFSGFKRILPNHQHYVKTNQKQSSEECLKKYNGE